MRHWQKADSKRTGLHGFRIGRDFGQTISIAAMFFKLQPRNRGGKGAGVNRHRDAAPQNAKCANVIFVRMGDKNRLDPVNAVDDPLGIGKNQVNTGGAVHIREGHAQIDKDIPLFAGDTVAINIAIHANFASPTKGEIDQSLVSHQRAFRLNSLI